MFGGGFGGGQEEEEQIPKGSDVYVELEASLEDLYLGATIKASPCGARPTLWVIWRSCPAFGSASVSCLTRAPGGKAQML